MKELVMQKRVDKVQMDFRTWHGPEGGKGLVVHDASGIADHHNLVTNSLTIAEVRLPVGEDLIYGNGRKGPGRARITKEVTLKGVVEFDGFQLCRSAEGEGTRRGRLGLFIGFNISLQLFQRGLEADTANFAIKLGQESIVADRGMFWESIGQDADGKGPRLNLLPLGEVAHQDDSVGKLPKHTLEFFVTHVGLQKCHIKNDRAGSAREQAFAEKRIDFPRPDPRSHDGQRPKVLGRY